MFKMGIVVDMLEFLLKLVIRAVPLNGNSRLERVWVGWGWWGAIANC